MPQFLRVVTYNMHAGAPEHGPVSLEDQAAYLARVDPDIVMLQEVDVRTARSGQVDQADRMAQLLGLPHFAFAAAMAHDGGLYGNAVLSRLPLQSTTSVGFRPRPCADRLHVDGKLRRWPESAEPRCCLICTVDWDGTSLAVVSGHLSLFPEERAPAARDILTALTATPAILGLDTNASDLQSPERVTLSSAFDDLTRGTYAHHAGTHPTSLPLHPIDTLLGRGVQSIAAGLLHSPASDHLGIWARIALPR